MMLQVLNTVQKKLCKPRYRRRRVKTSASGCQAGASRLFQKLPSAAHKRRKTAKTLSTEGRQP